MTTPGTSFADPGGGGAESRDVQVNLNADVSGYTNQVSAAQQATMGLSTAVDKLSASLGNLGKFAGKQLFHFAAAGGAGLAASIADAASLEHQLGTLRATAVVTGSSFRTMADGLDKVFTQFPVARREVVALAGTISNLGVTSPREVVANTRTFIKQGAATGEDSQALAAGGIQLGRMMGNTGADSLEKYANSALVLSKNMGVSVTGINEFAQAIAPMARAAGIGEAAVQGISAAFQKAGADGAYAANTFNKIITDISTLSQTGSPEIAKYASFAGKSSAQFKNQTATDQANQVFQGIAKGGPEALGFVSSLGLGPRDIRAVQGVAQSGGLQAAISTARGAATNTKALDSASEAAFKGLSDSVLDVGNEFTKLGEMLGGPFLGVLTKIVDAFDGFMSVVNQIVKSLGPIPGLLAALGSALAVPAGLALSHAGVIGTLALGRQVFGKNSMGRVAYRQGQAAGLATAGGMDPLDAMAMSPAGQRIQAGTANWRTQYPFMAGMNAGQRPPSAWQQRFGMSQWGMVGRGLSGAAGGLVGAGTWAVNSLGLTNWQSRIPGPLLPANQPPGVQGAGPIYPGFAQSVRTGWQKGPVGAFPALTKATLSLGASTVAAGASMAGATFRSAAQFGAGQLPQAAQTAIAAIKPIAAPAASIASRIGGALFSPIGMIATMIGVPLIGSIVSAIKQGNEKRADTKDALSGTSVYDTVLDRASTGLEKFGQSIDAASERLNKFAKTPTADFEQLGRVTGDDIAAIQGENYQVSDPKLTSIITTASKIAAQPGGDKDAVKNAMLAYLGSQNQQTPYTGASLTKTKEDFASVAGPSGYDTVTDTMMTYGRQLAAGTAGTPDYGVLARTAQAAAPGAGMGGLFGGENKQLEEFKKIYGTGVTGLQRATADTGLPGQQAALGTMVSMAAQGTSISDAGQKGRIEAANQILSQVFNIKPEELNAAITNAGEELGTQSSYKGVTLGGKEMVTTTPYGNAEDAARVQARGIASTDSGKALMQSLKLDEAGLLNIIQHPPALPAPSASGTITQLQKQGPYGRLAASSEQFVSAAVGKDISNPGAQFAAGIKIANDAAVMAHGNFGKAATELSKVADQIGGVTGALLQTGAAEARRQASLQLPEMSRADRLSELGATARRDLAAADPKNKPSDEVVAQAKASRDAADAGKEDQRQFNISRIKELRQFQIQAERSEEAHGLQVRRINRDSAIQETRGLVEYNRSVARTTEDAGIQKQRAEDAYGVQVARSRDEFRIQQKRAEEDYQLGVLRAQEDYQTQRLRAQEEFQIQQSRANRNHARDLERQAQASAESIYDPYSRYQVKATTDSGTLLYNLTEQNADIAKQMDELQKLKDQGLSQQSIDTLQLASPENAQQVSALTNTITPEQATQINAAIAQRVAATTALVQSPDNIAFRQSEEDFATSMKDASDDFSRSQKNMAADHAKTMQRMSNDFEKTTKKAAADQHRALKNMSDDFAVAQKNQEADLKKTLAHMHTDYITARDHARIDHKKALHDLATDFKTTQQQAADDLAESAKEYTGTFAQVFDQLATLAGGAVNKYAPAAADTINRELKRVKDSNPWLFGAPGTQPGSPGPTGYGAPGSGHSYSEERTGAFAPRTAPTHRDPAGPASGVGTGERTAIEGADSRTPGSPPPARPPSTAHAAGGITTRAHYGLVGESGPELILPLNSRGQEFMANIITKSLVQGVTQATAAAPSVSSVNSTDNSVSFSGADIKVVAADPDAMARQLAAKAKLRRLASPVRH